MSETEVIELMDRAGKRLVVALAQGDWEAADRAARETTLRIGRETADRRAQELAQLHMFDVVKVLGLGPSPAHVTLATVTRPSVLGAYVELHGDRPGDRGPERFIPYWQLLPLNR